MDATSENLNSIDAFIKKNFSSGESRIALVDLPLEEQINLIKQALTTLSSLGFTVIYVTTGKTSEELLKQLSDDGLDASSLYFVDAVSEMYGLTTPSLEKCRFVSGPINLGGITAAVEETLTLLKNNKPFVMLDSLTTVLLYNSIERTTSFVADLTTKLRHNSVSSIIQSIARGKTNKELLAKIAELVDDKLELNT